MTETQTEYRVNTDEPEPEVYRCRECGAVLGAIGRRESGGKTVTFLWRWSDKLYHADITCEECGRVATWAMNSQSFEALMRGR